MADEEEEGRLAEAARMIGSAAGKIASALGVAGETARPKAEVWSAEYVGSGTFIVHKPKRKPHKRRQSRLRGRRPGMRK